MTLSRAGNRDSAGTLPHRERTENAARRRAQLIEATIDSIVKNGLSRTTLAAVAAEAGLSPGVALFYFHTKETLFVETLRHYYTTYRDCWSTALSNAPDDPVMKLATFIFADLSDEISSPRNITLWQAFWGETRAHKLFADIARDYDQEHMEILLELCATAHAKTKNQIWTPKSLAATLESLTDGLLLRMHISPDFLNLTDARHLLADFLSSTFPGHQDKIRDLADQ